MIDDLKELLQKSYEMVEIGGSVIDVDLSDSIKDMPGCPLPLSGTVGLYDADKMAKWIYEVWKGDKG